MSERSEARRFAEELRGKRTGYTFADLERMLERSGCTVRGRGGSHRSFKHPRVDDILTLKDDGARAVLAKYIFKTRKFLECIAELPEV